MRRAYREAGPQNEKLNNGEIFRPRGSGRVNVARKKVSADTFQHEIRIFFLRFLWPKSRNFDLLGLAKNGSKNGAKTDPRKTPKMGF